MPNIPVAQKFSDALDALITRVKEDRSILAAILCGSLSHDTVWKKSDIDLIFVTIDDRKIEDSDLALNADGINVHAFMMSRTSFRKTVEGNVRNGFFHSFLAKGRLLYTHDETITTLCGRLREIGERDNQIQLLAAGSQAVSFMDKAHKWLITRGDLPYTALWILYAATPLARIEVLSARELADREVILQALKLNPKFFGIIYTGLLSDQKKTRKQIERVLAELDHYMAARARILFAPILDYLREAGEARSASEIGSHFRRNFGIEGVTTACEYLSDEGLIGKVSLPAQLTRRSNVSVEEMAFVDLGGNSQDGF